MGDTPIITEETMVNAQRHRLALEFGVNLMLSENWTSEEFRNAVAKKNNEELKRKMKEAEGR